MQLPRRTAARPPFRRTVRARAAYTRNIEPTDARSPLSPAPKSTETHIRAPDACALVGQNTWFRNMISFMEGNDRAVRLRHCVAIVVFASIFSACSHVQLNTCCVPLESVPQFRTIEIIGVSSALHGNPMKDDPVLLTDLRRELRRQFPSARLVDSGGDIQIIFILVDYEPGCLPNCGRFPTYRNWSGEVLTWMPRSGTNERSGTQVVGIDGWTYNPLISPIRAFVEQFRRYWLTSGHSAVP